MLEDMISVGPPKKALENYWSYLPGKCQKSSLLNLKKTEEESHQNEAAIQESKRIKHKK